MYGSPPKVTIFFSCRIGFESLNKTRRPIHHQKISLICPQEKPFNQFKKEMKKLSEKCFSSSFKLGIHFCRKNRKLVLLHFFWLINNQCFLFMTLSRQRYYFWQMAQSERGWVPFLLALSSQGTHISLKQGVPFYGFRLQNSRSETLFFYSRLVQSNKGTSD